MLIEREDKGLKVAFESWQRKTIVSEVGRKWVPVWWAGVSKCTSAVCSQSGTGKVQMTAVSWSQVSATRNAGDGLAESGQVSKSHVVQTYQHLNADSEPNRTQSTTSNQCSSLRRTWANPQSHLRVFETIRAAELRTRVATCRSSSSEHQSGESETIFDSACDERMNKRSDRVVVNRTLDAILYVDWIKTRSARQQHGQCDQWRPTSSMNYLSVSSPVRRTSYFRSSRGKTDFTTSIHYQPAS